LANPESNEEPKLTKLQHAFKALLGGLKLSLVILFVVAIVGILLTIAGVLSTSLFITAIKVMMAINMAVMAGIFVVLTILAPRHYQQK
jgi:hypothetical protein